MRAEVPRIRRATEVIIGRALIVVVVLCGWQWVPPWLTSHGQMLLNPAYVGSPSTIAASIWEFVGGSQTAEFYPPLVSTLAATFVAIGLGIILGIGVALVMAELRVLDSILSPFLLLLNGVPRIIIFPVLILVFGFGISSKIVAGITVSFFLAYYNAYAGARYVNKSLVRSVDVLGGNTFQRLIYVTGPSSAASVFVSLPNVVSFTIVAVITSEVLGGTGGLGYLLVSALNRLDAPQLFAIGCLSSVVSLCLVGLTTLAARKWLPWAGR
jgi:NitT/TauT family transport system permease protein